MTIVNISWIMGKKFAIQFNTNVFGLENINVELFRDNSSSISLSSMLHSLELS